MKRLNELHTNEHGTVISMGDCGNLKRRFFDLGLIKGTKVKCVGKSPGGEASAYLIRGAVIAIRSSDCSEIYIG